MADERISDLVQIGEPTSTPPYPTAFTSRTTGAMLEILDTTNSTMASTGTNSRIAPGDLIKGFTAAGTNITLTETSGVVSIASGPTGMTITQHAGIITTDLESASAVTCNLAISDWHLVVLNNNVAISISNPTVGQQFVLVLQQAAAGGPYSISSWFTGTINWIGSPYTSPTMPTTASAYLTATFKCISAGVYLGWWTGNSAA